MQVVPLPTSTSEAQVFANDEEALRRWQGMLERRWGGESLSWWRLRECGLC